MPRTREFDPKEALEKATKAFWRMGYSNTSISDLVAATGVSRHGLYDQFATKHGLFLTCLDHYQATVVTAVFGVVEHPAASADQIRAYFAKLLDLSRAGDGSFGCMMANAASDVAPYDRRAAIKVSKYRVRLSRGFEKALLNAKAKGEVTARIDVHKASDFFTGVVHGLSALARSHADPEMMANVVATALACLE